MKGSLTSTSLGFGPIPPICQFWCNSAPSAVSRYTLGNLNLRYSWRNREAYCLCDIPTQSGRALLRFRIHRRTEKIRPRPSRGDRHDGGEEETWGEGSSHLTSVLCLFQRRDFRVHSGAAFGHAVRFCSSAKNVCAPVCRRARNPMAQ